MWPWAAVYAAQVTFGMFMWNVVYVGGTRGWLVGLISVVPFGAITLGLLTLMGLLTGSLNWFVWAGLIFFLVGMHHSPPLDDLTPLSPGRRVVGFACLILLVLLVPPVPIELG